MVRAQGGEAALAGWKVVLDAVHAAGGKIMPQLWHAGVQSQPGDVPDPGAASVAALGKDVELEHPATRCTTVDLDPADAAGEVEALLQELLQNDGDTLVALRVGRRLVARLARHAPPADAAADTGASALRVDAYGSLDAVKPVALERRPPGPGEVEIEVAAAGLNFRDVLSALGMLGDYVRSQGVESASDLPFGHECAGTVTAVGAGVTHVREGDAVVAALAPGSLASHVVARRASSRRNPPHHAGAGGDLRSRSSPRRGASSTSPD